MLTYPQLSTGTVAQYPLRKVVVQRTIVNECLDGRTVKLADGSAGTIEWELNYGGLTEAEWSQIRMLFQATQGRLRSFVFLDPTDNLLRFSESLSSTVWQKDGLLGVSAGVNDPVSTMRASRLVNSASIDQTISQAITSAGWFRYCFSGYLRSDTPTAVTVSHSTADGEETRREQIGPGWRRVQSTGAVEGAATEIKFTLSLPPLASVEVFGLQVEAQVQASEYKETRSQSGVYPATRFMEDTLSPVAMGVNDYSVQVRLTSKSGS